MGKGFFISKTVRIAGIVLAAGALATIIALSVVYSQEKSKNNKNEVKPTGAITTSVPTTEPSNEPWDQWRLPQTLSPQTYNVTLWPRLQPDATGLYIFTGLSSVVFRCVEKTNLILIHSNKLNMTQKPTLTALGSKPAPTIESIVMHTKTQYMAIHLKEELTAGESYELYTEFVGELANDLGGFYRSEYYENGVKKVVATTQMQATDARKAFPCFDEPAMKAIFHITLYHDPATVALSNSVVKDEVNVTIDNTLVTRTTFEPTEVMSTYLLAFIVSDFIYIEEIIEDLQKQIRIFARQEAINAGQGDYALSVTGKILRFFQGYYNVPYPLPKSDQIALPDFNAGAMENWGLITYRETGLLYDEEISSNGNKERIVTIIAHELAHQWFGNLVTIRWWNDLWLNEGFASYVEYLGADDAEQEWNIKDLIVLNDVHRVFAIDALASSHPLSSKEEDIQRPEQISEVFDTISYSKGASVLRMLSDFLTETVFTQGLRTYLDHFKYSNTVYTDLWEHLQRAVDSSGTTLPRSVQEIMDRWVLQMGFPVVTINTATGQITQEHFLLDPDTKPDRPSEFNYEWLVPISWTKKEAAEPLYWLLEKTTQMDQMKTSGDVWVLANINVTGYYRVNYDNENWQRLLNVLKTSRQSIPVINRAQIIDDAFNLAKAGIIETTLALRTTLFLNSETEYMPWESALDNLDYFYLMFDRTEVYGPMQTYVGNQVKNLFEYFTTLTNWEDVPQGHTDQYNQVNALRVACSTGYENCTTLVKTWFQQWMENPNVNPIKANLRSTVYCSAIAAGGEKEWNFAWEMFEKATIASEKDKLRAALACATEPWLLNRYLKYTLDPDIIRKQDATSTIVSIASNVVGQPLAWDFVRANWEYIFNEYGGGSFSFSNLINGITKRFSTEFELQQLIQFRDDYAHIGFGSGTLAIQQSIERTTANIKWVEKNQQAVLEWFRNPL